ncbi:MAG: hypothetical protein RLO81_18745 [Fulvivirga sp.]|uniref:hypothetical protein n=1 Tax=Fulvivirga sp. TaxID=1931237 RepID=UPI0032ED0DB5
MDKKAISLYKTIRLIHWALLTPMLLFAVFAYISNLGADRSDQKGLEVLIYLPLFMMVMAITAGRFLYSRNIAKSRGKVFNTRLQIFMTATIIRDAFYEAAGLTAGVAAYITGNNTILLLIPIILLQFYASRPTHLKIENDLEATRDEMKALCD